MAEQPGYITKVYYSADDSTYTQIGSLSSFSDEISTNMESIAELGGGAWDVQLPTLKSVSMTLDGNLDPADTQQAALYTKIVSGDTIYIKALFDGSSVGYKCAVKVASLSRTAPVDGKATFSCSLTGTAAPTSLP